MSDRPRWLRALDEDLADIARACDYNSGEWPDPPEEGEDSAETGIDALIDFKDELMDRAYREHDRLRAMERRAELAEKALRDVHRVLHPENYHTEDYCNRWGLNWSWSPDTPEAIEVIVNRVIERIPGAKTKPKFDPPF